jgi:DNA-binding beta-propeller fold protein YncE
MADEDPPPEHTDPPPLFDDMPPTGVHDVLSEDSIEDTPAPQPSGEHGVGDEERADLESGDRSKAAPHPGVGDAEDGEAESPPSPYQPYQREVDDPGREADDLIYAAVVDEVAADLQVGEDHTPEEIQQRRAAAHRRHRRNGRIRLIGVVAVIALIVVILIESLGSSSKHATTATRAHGSPVAASGSGPGHLATGSSSALPGNLLIADRGNHRLVVVSPRGQVVWEYPEGAAVSSDLFPDFAFFTPSGREITITQEGNFVIAVLDVASRQVVYGYGHFDVPGSSANRLHDPSAALRVSTGQILAADIRNCRVIVVTPPDHHVVHQFGTTGRCVHDPPTSLATPTTAFPTSDGGIVINEESGAWADLISRSGKLVRSVHPPGLHRTSATSEVSPGVLISVEHTHPGAVEIYTTAGKRLWLYDPRRGAGELADPSLAFVLADGNVLVSDDYDDRVIVIDRHSKKIVWQYGHTHEAGSAPGYLDLPVGIDLVKPYSLLDGYPAAAPPP